MLKQTWKFVYNFKTSCIKQCSLSKFKVFSSRLLGARRGFILGHTISLSLSLTLML